MRLFYIFIVGIAYVFQTKWEFTFKTAFRDSDVRDGFIGPN